MKYLHSLHFWTYSNIILSHHIPLNPGLKSRIVPYVSGVFGTNPYLLFTFVASCFWLLIPPLCVHITQQISYIAGTNQLGSNNRSWLLEFLNSSYLTQIDSNHMPVRISLHLLLHCWRLAVSVSRRCRHTAQQGPVIGFENAAQLARAWAAWWDAHVPWKILADELFLVVESDLIAKR